MRFLLILLFIAVSVLTKGQQPSLQNLQSDICNCLDKNAVSQTNSQGYSDCFLENFKKYRELIRAIATKKYGDSAKFKSEEFMNGLHEKLMFELIRDCGTYCRLMDDLREAQYHNKTKPELLKELKMRKTMDRKFSGNYFWYRGDVYFQLGDYKNALIDADSSIRDKPKDGREYSLKAWIKESQGDYAEALKFYQKAYSVQPDPEYKISIAIVQRKQKIKQGKK